MQFLFAAMVVAVIVAVAWAIRWGVRRLGVNPSFLACVVIAIVLLAFLAEFCLYYVPRKPSGIGETGTGAAAGSR